MSSLSRRLLGLLAALACVLAGCSSNSPTQTAPHPASPAGTSRATASAASVDPGPAVASFLKVHNDARKAVGVPPLEWSAELAVYAQAWADRLAAQGGDLVHRTDLPQGENLAGGRGGTPSPKQAAELWLRERDTYRDGPVGSQDNVGHYTAMVWRTTTHVGYGMATSADGNWVVVANYSPAGNIVGRHPYR